MRSRRWTRSLSSERRQLHRDERFQLQEAKLGCLLASIDVGNRQVVVGTDFFSREDDVDRVPGLRFRAVEEQVDVLHMAMDEPRFCQRRFGGFEILSTQDDIDVLSIPDCRFVNPRHPGRDGVASHDGVGNVRLLQSFRGARADRELFPRP